eukprot:754809-Hanusia_phi.AAC.4
MSIRLTCLDAFARPVFSKCVPPPPMALLNPLYENDTNIFFFEYHRCSCFLTVVPFIHRKSEFKMVFCANCGQSLPDVSKFCSSCGKPVQTAAAPGKPSAPPSYSMTQKPQQQQQATCPPGTFKVQLPYNVHPGQIMKVAVPQGYPQAGQVAQFQVPPGAKPGGFVFAPLPAPGQQFQQYAPAPTYYGRPAQSSGGSTAIAAGAGALGECCV